MSQQTVQGTGGITDTQAYHGRYSLIGRSRSAGRRYR